MVFTPLLLHLKENVQTVNIIDTHMQAFTESYTCLLLHAAVFNPIFVRFFIFFVQIVSGLIVC